GVLLAGSLAISSCNLEEVRPIMREKIAVIADDAYATLQFDMNDEEIDNWNVSSVGGRETNRKPFDAPCANVSYEPSTRTLTIDFGTTGCVGKDGKKRQGKIVHVYSQDRKVETTTLIDYFVDGNKVEGTRVRTWVNGRPPIGKTLEVKLSSGKITFTDGTTLTLEGSWTRTISLAQGELTTETGSCSGKTRKDIHYNSTIEKPLVRKTACFTQKIPYIVEGIRKVTLHDGKQSTIIMIDYGNGECDNKATVTINGKTREIELGSRYNGND
ncbi:MAG: hypothetical protein NZ521_11150, partial [Flammeovirgaceae bacterium]|nr:hypothetical protein [Flammeovirgaceae bacterium]MDW8288758.1 hypothetical protein [Flammeovirgaceae bacterium]